MLNHSEHGIERPARHRSPLSGAAHATTGAAAPERSAPQWPRRALRIASGGQAALVFAQAVLAGHLLSGSAVARTVHQELGTEGLTWIALIQIVLAVLAWRPGRGPAWLIAVTAATFSAVVVQIGVGFAGRVSIHVPLGVAILAVNLALALWLRPLARIRVAGGTAASSGPHSP